MYIVQPGCLSLPFYYRMLYCMNNYNALNFYNHCFVCFHPYDLHMGNCLD